MESSLSPDAADLFRWLAQQDHAGQASEQISFGYHPPSGLGSLAQVEHVGFGVRYSFAPALFEELQQDGLLTCRFARWQHQNQRTLVSLFVLSRRGRRRAQAPSVVA